MGNLCVFESLYFDTVVTFLCAHGSEFEQEQGFLPWSKGVYPGDWTRAETYAHDILGDLNHWAEGWTDWNAFLGADGGPNWVSATLL